MLVNVGMVELADAPDSKSGIGNYVWVQVPLPAPRLNFENYICIYWRMFFKLREKFMIYTNAKAKELMNKINVNNVHVVADFDKTLTSSSSKASWSILSESGLLPEEYTIDRDALYAYYKPIENDASLGEELRQREISIWYQKHIALFQKYKLKEEIVEKAAADMKTMKLREGVQKFLKFLCDFNVPLVIISAGVGNFIEANLKKNECCFNNIYISSNIIEFKEGVAVGIKGSVIHGLNKGEVSLPDDIKERLEQREYIILLGDQLDDIQMVDENKRKDAVCIGFIADGNESSIEEYKKHFDIVCETGTSYDELMGWLYAKKY